MKIRSCILWASTALCTLPAHAQDNSGESVFLDQIVVTANRSEGSLGTVAQSVEIISEEQIEETKILATDTSDLVSRLVPGYAPSNQTISGASESFRGRSVLIMVDGVPRNTPLRNNSRILSLINMENIARIEVVNGASSLYGAGATGGTINIITKRGVEDGINVTATVGATAFTANLPESIAPNANVSVEGRNGKFDYFFSLSGDFSRRTYDGAGNELASDGMLGQGGADRISEGEAFGVIGYETDAKRFEISADLSYARQDPDWYTDYSTGTSVPDYSNPYDGEPLEENSQYFTARYTDADFSLGSLEVKAFYNHIEKQSLMTELSSVNTFVYTSDNQTVLYGDRAGLNASVNSALDFLTEGSNVTWGVDYTFDRTTQETIGGADVIAPMTQNQIAGFAQAEIPIVDRFRMQAGARFDQFFLSVDDFTRPESQTNLLSSLGLPVATIGAVDVTGGDFSYNQWTFNIGGVFDVTEEMQAYGNFSQGYALADVGAFTRRAGANTTAELCSISGIAGVCTGSGTTSFSDISPEPQLVNTYEIGLRGDWDMFRANLSAYFSTSDKGTTFDISSNSVSQQKERLWGVEFNGEAHVLDWMTVGSVLAYSEGQYDTDDDGEFDSYLPNNRIPTTFKGLLYSTMNFEHDITARAEVEFFSGRSRDIDNKIDGAVLLNAAVAKTFENNGKLSLGVRNILDTDYINPTATATRGISVAGLGRTIALSYQVKF
ncbi:TonB-dependent receptor [Roseibium polysiphoniae]|uniref:TonB-dependent receptor n=1 Tax=Roseibium polysiphoniae TaxID=2571221 RepID=A0ABR9CAQ3_9HYPH|nr:TonB-dependent receptor [Roseibium polysiphoniae]MBD8876978.1 TonB-dependent receptor [Roseibium polysiphoniae]